MKSNNQIENSSHLGQQVNIFTKIISIIAVSCIALPQTASAEIKIIKSSNKDNSGILFNSNIDNVNNKDGSTSIKLNVSNKYTTDAFVEIYDSKGKLQDIKVIDANRPPTGFIQTVIKMPGDAVKDISTGFDRIGLDLQTVEATIPPGGSFKITKTSNSALTYNSVMLLLELKQLSGGDPTFTKSAATKALVMGYIKEIGEKSAINIFTGAALPKAGEVIKDGLNPSFLDAGKSAELLSGLVKYSILKSGDDPTKNPIIAAFGDFTQTLLNEGIEVATDKLLPGLGTVIKGVRKTGDVSLVFLRAVDLARQYTYGSGSELVFSDIIKSIDYDPGVLVKQVTSCSTLYNTSHIGSASCSFPIANNTGFKAADIPVQTEIDRKLPQPIQAANTYTNGTIVKAPLDIGLTWNQSTNLDLDSHTVTPNGEHVYFSERGSLNNAPNTFLYRDSIPAAGSLGAEQTRITSFQEGEYRFYVYNFSDQQNLAPAGLSNSAAKVEIFQGGAPLTDIPNDPNNFDLNNPALQKVGQPYPGQNTFNVPTGQSGNTWYVFKLDTRTGILTRVNRFGNVDGSGNVPKFR